MAKLGYMRTNIVEALPDQRSATLAEALMEGMSANRTREAISSIRSTLAICQPRHAPGAADLARRAREALA